MLAFSRRFVPRVRTPHETPDPLVHSGRRRLRCRPCRHRTSADRRRDSDAACRLVERLDGCDAGAPLRAGAVRRHDRARTSRGWPAKRSKASPTSRRCRSSAPVELAVRERSVLPATSSAIRTVRLARSPLAQPGLGRDRFGRRLHRDQQPRRRRERPRDHRRAGGQAGDAGDDCRHRPRHRHRAPEDRGERPAGAAVGRLDQACRSASGCSRSAARFS